MSVGGLHPPYSEMPCPVWDDANWSHAEPRSLQYEAIWIGTVQASPACLQLQQPGVAIFDEVARLVIIRLKRGRVGGRVEGFSLPPLDHGCIFFLIGVFRFLDISCRSEACRRRLDQGRIA